MLHLKRSSSKTGWMACVPSGAQARFAVVERKPGGDKPVVRWVHEEPWADMPRALRHARRLGHARRHQCVVLLQRQQYQLLPMDAPDVPREDWRSAVRWQLSEMVDFPVEAAGVDVLAVPPEASSRHQATLIAAAAPAEALRPLVEAGQETGLSWQAVDVPETALRNLSALYASDGRSHALLHIGETHGTLVITLGGELLLSRQIDVTQAQIADENESMRQMAFDRAGLELQRTLDGFERVFTLTSLERLQVLPGPGIEAFCDYVRELVYVPVLVADPAEVLDFSAVPALGEHPEAVPAYLVAIGAALRPEGRQALDLFDPALRPQRERWRAVHGLWAVAAALAFALLLSAALDAWSVRRRDEAARLEQQVASERQLMGRNGGVPGLADANRARAAELQRLRAQDAAQRRVHAALDAQAAGQKEGYTAYLMALSRQAHPALWITGFGVGADGQSLELQGRMTDAAVLPDYLRRLNGEAQFKGRSFAQLSLKAADPRDAAVPAGITEFTLRSVSTGVPEAGK